MNSKNSKKEWSKPSIIKQLPINETLKTTPASDGMGVSGT